MCSSGHDEEVAFEEEWLEGSSAEHGRAMSEVVEAAGARTKGVLCLTPCTVYKEEPCCAAVVVRAEGCAVDVAADRVTAGIKDQVAVVVIGGRSAIIVSVAETSAARVMHESAAIAVVAEAAAAVRESVAAEAARVGLKVDGDFVEGVASWVMHEIVEVAKTVTCKRRRRTVAVAVVTGAVAIFTHCSVFVLVIEPVTTGVECAVAVAGVTVEAVGTEAVVVHAAFAIVGAVLVAVENLRFPP
jgi:hypothetical protein